MGDMFYRVNPLEEVGLNQGSVISAVVSGIEATFVRILINDRLPGRICRSEITDPAAAGAKGAGGKPPTIKIGKSVKVRVVGVSKAVKKAGAVVAVGEEDGKNGGKGKEKKKKDEGEKKGRKKRGEEDGK